MTQSAMNLITLKILDFLIASIYLLLHVTYEPGLPPIQLCSIVDSSPTADWGSKNVSTEARCMSKKRWFDEDMQHTLVNTLSFIDNRGFRKPRNVRQQIVSEWLQFLEHRQDSRSRLYDFYRCMALNCEH